MRFLNKFNSISDAKAGKDIYSPQVTLVKENGEKQVMYSKDDFEDNTKLQVYGDEIGGLSFIVVQNNIIKYTGSAKVTPYSPSALPTIISNDFNSTTKKGVIKFETDVTSIGTRAFNDCGGLTSIEIPNSVTSIGAAAFYGCSGLASVIIPNSVKSIEGSAFAYCSGLTSVTIPNSVISIGNRTFEGCRGLSSMTIPNSVTSIGNYAFMGCRGLSSVTIEADTPPTLLGSSVFYNTNCPIYVPAESVESYKTASGWSSYASRIQPIPTTVE